MDAGAEPTPIPPRKRPWPFGRDREAGPPPREQRAWVHPSELPSFDTIPAYDAVTAPHTRLPRNAIILATGVVVLALGSVTLALRSTTAPATSALTNTARTVSELPSFAQAAARSTVELVITDDGHLSAAAAMVIAPGNLAVTTYPIPPNASISGSSQTSERFAVTLVTHDKALGFWVLKLSQTQPITPTNILPSASTVLAISPLFTAQARSPEIEWANTTLGDPVVEQADGIVSYLATASDRNLDGYVDTLAVTHNGDVVAVLTVNHQWYSAQYVTKVAQVVSENGGCHGRLGISGTTAQGGGVQVDSVLAGPSVGRLRAGDILTSINGVPLDSMDTLLEYLYATPDKLNATLHFLRGGQERTTDVILACQP